MSRPSSGTTYGSLPLIGSSRQADNDDRDDASLAGQPGTEGTRSSVSRAPSATSAPRPAGARPLREMSSCPSNLRSPSTSGDLDPTPGAPADELPSSAPSTSLPDIDDSMLSMQALSTGVSDAHGFQRHKLRRAFMDHDAPHKRQKANVATIGCRRCGTEDTPRWRNGPEGPGTLCNVCGLLSASRERRKHPATEPRRE